MGIVSGKEGVSTVGDKSGFGPRVHSVSWTLVAALCGAFAATRVLIFANLVGIGSDLWTHQQYAAQLFQGQIPFRDFFPEYPPLTLWFTSIPAVLAPTMVSYFTIFRVLCCLIDVGIWLKLVALLKSGSIDWPALLLYVFGTTVLGPLLYDRVDIVLAAILLAAAVSLRAGNAKGFQFGVGLGIAFKLIPVVLVPFALAMQWQNDRRGLPRAVGLLFAPTLLSFAVVAAFGGYRLDRMFAYHLERGTQIESIPASIQMVLMMCGVPGEEYHDFGCANLRTPFGHWLALACTAILAMVVASSAFMAMRRALNPPTAAIWMAAILAASLSLSKVLSPQFFIFLLPVLVVLPLRRGWRARTALWAIIVVTFGLTGAVFPWYYGDLCRLEITAQLMVIVRNECLIALTIWLSWHALNTGEHITVEH